MPRRKKNSEGITEAVLITPPHGRGKIRTGGNPGNKGGGRTANEFMQRMRELVNGPEVEAYTERCIKGEFGPKFHLEARKWAADRAYGKAHQSVELTGADGGPLEVIVTRKVVKARGDDKP